MHTVERVLSLGEKGIDRITLHNKNHMVVKLLNYGAAIEEISVPDKHGVVENVVLTHERVEDYIKNPSYFGATVGRTAGRIAQGSFTLNGRVYHLPKNYGTHHGHGGPGGFSFRLWDYVIRQGEDRILVEFCYTSAHMEEGYPGELAAKVTYTLTDQQELMIAYEAKADRRTLCNLTNHAYFNLSGNYKRKITEQYLRIKADCFLELNNYHIPTGKLLSVKNTPMDFRAWKAIGADIQKDDVQLILAGGYDHPWILTEQDHAIEMMDLESGRKMSITTTYPCVVVYSYNFPNGERLKYGKVGSKQDGICFETQYEPDGIHHGGLHSAILDVHEVYCEKTLWKFSIV